VPKKKKTDTEVLFPEVTYNLSIGEVTVKPFTYGDVIDLSPYLEEILHEIRVRGVRLNAGIIDVDVSDIITIYLGLGKAALPILSRVTGKDEDDLRKLSILESAQLITTIIQQNLGVFVSFFAQFLGAFRQNGSDEAETPPIT
jgi:hypothetical protein